MSAQLYALGRWCFRNRGKVIAAWLALLVLLGGLAAGFRGSFDDEFRIPGSPSQAALDKLAMTFPQGAALSASAIVVAPEGMKVTELRPQIEAAVEQFNEVDVVDMATSPWNELVSGLVSPDETAAVINLSLTIEDQPTNDQLETITAAAERIEATMPPGTSVDMGGQAFNIELPALSPIEAIGLGVALVVLLVVLGSLVAAGLPLVTAIVGVGMAMAILMLITRIANISSVTPMLAVMLGLAVGIDYALFILSRHRDHLRSGMDVEESTGRAVGTAGSAVVFAGLTVFIALLGLGVAGIPFITVMGIFAALAVVFAVLIALTMLPALMGVVGERMRPRSVRAAMAAQAAGETEELPDADASPADEPAHAAPRKARGAGPFRWWVNVTTSHPRIIIVAVVALLGALALPALGMQLALPNSGQHEAHAQDRIAYDLIDKHFGPGYNGPLIVTADIISSTDPLGLVASLKADIEELPGVDHVALATPNEDADTALIQIIPTTASDDPATADLVQVLRDKAADWKDRYGVDTAVTGFTAVQIDVTEKLGGALLPFGILVVGLSLVLLAAVFRSVWVPVKATLGYLLSVGAAFGASALVFNQGFAKELINLEKPMPLISFLPILVMGILFGLAMDYEVFLVSRMREEYVHGKSAVESVRDGFVASGPVVVAAAVIMFAVFAFFVPEGMGPIKQIAFALAFGVAVDAFLIRMTLVPAVMALLGDRAWWLPTWLDKLLPVFDVEGEVLTKQVALADWPGTDALVHAEDLAVEGVVDPVSLAIHAGDVVGFAGPVGARTGLALALSGRLEVTGGRARVAGELLPEAAGRVRRRTTLLDLAETSDIAADLDAVDPAQGGVVFVDSVDVVGSGAERDALRRLADRAREGDFALVLCAAHATALTDFSPDGVLTVAESTLQGSNA